MLCTESLVTGVIGFSDTTGQQSDQAGEARRLRVHQLPELPDPVTALRREAQLGPARDGHTPVKSEVHSMPPIPSFLVNTQRLR
jgi:hypothetical protein